MCVCVSVMIAGYTDGDDGDGDGAGINCATNGNIFLLYDDVQLRRCIAKCQIQPFFHHFSVRTNANWCM